MSCTSIMKWLSYIAGLWNKTGTFNANLKTRLKLWWGEPLQLSHNNDSLHENIFHCTVYYIYDIYQLFQNLFCFLSQDKFSFQMLFLNLFTIIVYLKHFFIKLSNYFFCHNKLAMFYYIYYHTATNFCNHRYNRYAFNTIS